MDANNAPAVRTSEWVLTIFLLAIPIVNIILTLVWAFGGGANPSKATFAKAYLIWMVIGIVLSIIFYVTMGAAMMAAVSSGMY